MPGERLPYPTERDNLDDREEQFELRLFGPMPGRVQSYDPDLQTADIVPLIRQQVPQPDGSYAMEDLPVVPSVPVCFPRSGDAMVTLPIAAGDTGLLIVCGPAIGHWRVGDGDVTDPGDLRRFHLSHAVFLPVGLVPRSKALRSTGAAGATAPPESAPTGIVLGFDGDGSRVLVRANGSVDIETGGAVRTRVDSNGIVNLGAATGAAFVALASRVDAELAALRTAIASAVPVPNDGGAALKTAMLTWTPTSVAAQKVKAT